MDCENYVTDDYPHDDESSVSVTNDECQVDYGDVEDTSTNMSDLQTPFLQQYEDDHLCFPMVASTSTTLLDDTTPIFQEDITAV